MAERTTVVEKEVIRYSGLFSVKELYQLIEDFENSKGYFPVENFIEESVEKEGKVITAKLAPFKKLTDYAKAIIKIDIMIDNCKEVEIKRAGKKQKLNKGNVVIEIMSILETDYEHRWEMKPWLYVLRTVFEKYIYTPFLSGFKNALREDTDHLKEQIKAFLNLYKK
ncbi:hypothetical protein KY338_02295 [Candidatus Woesearchaeota archaeon]|nr:hypothetical protein [Candidatus Woesearchaeota archaeon]MBW3006122.1 hypothetical protein [Candidatus Woesearchaeota archaeon]